MATCKVCASGDNVSAFGIGLKQTFICERCTTAIMLQQVTIKLLEANVPIQWADNSRVMQLLCDIKGLLLNEDTSSTAHRRGHHKEVKRNG